MRLDNVKNIKRLVVYFFHDEDGIVDRYIPYLLSDLMKNCSDLFVVCNGKLTAEGRKEFLSFTPHLLVRENSGFDAWAYKAVFEHYGWDRLSVYDEIIMMNSTVYGPLYPFREMFQEMNKRDIDFWGITKFHEIPNDPFGNIPYGYIPERIQSYFTCVRSNMFKSLEFHDFWDNLPEMHSYEDFISKYEAIFTQKFTDFGFRSDTYIDTDDLADVSNAPLIYKSLELIKNRKCPVVMRRQFGSDYFRSFMESCGEATIELIPYMQNHLDYDFNMILDNILRVGNLADIKNVMHLNRVLPRNYSKATVSAVKVKRKIALFFHVYYESLVENTIYYASMMPADADIYFITGSKICREKLVNLKDQLVSKNVSIIDVENRGRDVSALLVAAAPYVMKYDIVCFAHDKKTSQLKPYTIGESFAYHCLENILASKEYVENIISTFQEESRLGMLMPPPPRTASFFGTVAREWGPNFNNTVDLAKALGIHVNLDESKEAIAPLGTMFWFRSSAMKKLYSKKWEYKDFPAEPNPNDGTFLHAIERIYSYAVQSEGYYVAWCTNDQYASLMLTNYNYALREIVSPLFDKYGITTLYPLTSFAASGQDALSLRLLLKRALKKKTPICLWKCARKIYLILGGKKWVA